jgi:hypothetical protein
LVCIGVLRWELSPEFVLAADSGAIALLALELLVIECWRELAYLVGVVARAAAQRARSNAIASASATTAIVASNP